MYNVLVSLSKTDTPQPAGVTFGHTVLTVTDSAGAVQTMALSGTETPPWTQAVTVQADGASAYLAQDVDTSGAAIGAPVTASFTPQAATFPATTAISVVTA